MKEKKVASHIILIVIIINVLLFSTSCLKKDSDQEIAKKSGQKKESKSSDKQLTIKQAARKSMIVKGRNIAFWRVNSIYLYIRNNKKIEKIASAKNVIDLTWAADNKTLAFIAGQGKQDEAGEFSSTVINILDTSSNEFQPLTVQPGKIIQPAWDPSGTRIIFTRVTSNKDQDIYLYDFQNSREYPLTNDGRSFMATWSADGKRLAYLKGKGSGSYSSGFVNQDIWIMDLEDGTNERFHSFKGSPDNPNSIVKLTWQVEQEKLSYLDLSKSVIGTINILDKKIDEKKIKLNGERLLSQLAFDFDSKYLIYVTEEQINPSGQPFSAWLFNLQNEEKEELIEGSYLIAWY